MAIVKRTIGTAVIAALWIFDLNDPRSHIAKDRAAKRTRNDTCQIQDDQIFQSAVLTHDCIPPLIEQFVKLDEKHRFFSFVYVYITHFCFIVQLCDSCVFVNININVSTAARNHCLF